MKDNQTIGVATIAIGMLLLIGVFRGTWRKIWGDVVTGTGQTGSAPTSTVQTFSNVLPTVTQNTAPSGATPPMPFTVGPDGLIATSNIQPNSLLGTHVCVSNDGTYRTMTWYAGPCPYGWH